MRKLVLICLGLILLFGPGLTVRAQGLARADLYPPDAASAFPTVSALLDVFNASGMFVTGLKAEAVTVFEDGQPLPLQELTEQAVPAQIVVAVNPGPALDVRDPQGISRFQRLSQVLGGWAQGRPADLPDDLSLVTIAGPIIAHASTADWLVSLNAFQPDFRTTIPNLQSLAMAIDLASVQTPRSGMKRAILFITPHMEDANIDSAIQPLIQRAVQNRVHVFIWFVDADLYFATTSAVAFNQLALQTGGSFFAYSGSERFPDPESYFAPLRRLYSLRYTSQLKRGGQHMISVQAETAGGTIKSADQAFNVDIQPPNPIFVSPPLQITRRPPEEDPFNTKILLPEKQEVDIIVEFPDGHKRPLLRTTLYVDGQIASENTAEPFDKFTWDLSGYALSGQHEIIVEAVDSLGLNKTSVPIPVTVTVIQPPRGPAAFFARYRQLITISAVALAGLVLLTILLTGRLRLPALLRARAAAQKAYGDPLTQPVDMPVETPAALKQKSKRRIPWTPPARVKLIEAPASLIRLRPDGEPATANPIPLAEKEMAFGTDPVQCNHVLDDPSLSPLHARLKRTEDGGFLLSDAGSVAGTWVNYEPITREGHALQHGDVIHFGQLVYRFELRSAPSAAEPKIETEKPAA